MKWPFACYLTALFLIAPLRSELVINEIFYNAPDDLDIEFVELYHPGSQALDVSKWQLSDKKGVLFEFPAGSLINAGDYVVLCREPALFEEFYGFAAMGEIAHGLGNGGDTLILKDAEEKVRDEVTYDDSGPWPVVADGYSASLERITHHAPGNAVTNWEPSPSSKYYQTHPGGTPGTRNEAFQDRLPPQVAEVRYRKGRIGLDEPVEVTVTLASSSPAAGRVQLFYNFVTPGSLGKVAVVTMALKEDGHYVGTLPSQGANGILRFKVVALGKDGATRVEPSTHALRPAFSLLVSEPVETDLIPAASFILPTKDYLADRRQRRWYSRGRDAHQVRRAQGDSAMVLTDPETKETMLFDFIHIHRRTGGYKVRLHKDRKWRDMSTINVLAVYGFRFSLCESLAFEFHRRAGVPSSWADYFRLMIDGEPQDFHLAFEQPNKSFLRRHKLDDDGNLYKAIWQGSHRPSARAYAPENFPDRVDVIGRHEKKTNVHEDYDDLIDLVKRLESGEVLEKPTNVINYFAANSLLSHWDGFHNNYFIYHEVSKKKDVWWMFPWDQDKTWGYHDGIHGDDVFSDLPLAAGSESYLPVGVDGPGSRYRRNIGLGGAPWWRYGGEVSRAVLEHPETRLLFLKRLRELATTVFTEQAFGPEIDRLERRLLPEVRWQAKTRNRPNQTETLKRTLAIFRRHLKERRQFVLDQEEIRELP